MAAALAPPDGRSTLEYLQALVQLLGDGDYGVLREGPDRPFPTQAFLARSPRQGRALFCAREVFIRAPEAPRGPTLVLLRDADIAALTHGHPTLWARRALDLRYLSSSRAVGLLQPVRPTADEGPDLEAACERSDLPPFTAAMARIHSGFARLAGRDPQGAHARFEEAASSLVGVPWLVGECTLFQALSLLQAGDGEGAFSLAERAWRAFRALGWLRGEAEALGVLARAHWRLGDAERARTSALEAISYAERSSAGRAWADGLLQALEYQDRSLPAEASAKAAEAVFLALGDRASAGLCRLALGRDLAARRDHAAAMVALRAAREALLPGSPTNAGNASLALAKLLRRGGQGKVAAELAREARQLQTEGGSLLNLAHVQEFQALLAAENRDLDGAVREYLGAFVGFRRASRTRDLARVTALLDAALEARLAKLLEESPEERREGALRCLWSARRARRSAAVLRALEVLDTTESRARAAWLRRRLAR